MTRYPRSGKGRKWTALELKAIPAAWKGDTLSDSQGLSGEVRTNSEGLVSIRFKYAFKWLTKVTWHQCGTWPTVSLEDIRTNRDRARDLIRTGVNPNDQVKAERITKQTQVTAVITEAARESAQNLPFSAMFNAWLADGVARKDDNAELRRAFEKDRQIAY